MKDDGEVLQGTWVSSGMGGEAIGCLGGLTCIPLVAVVVNLIAGEDQLPTAIQGTTPWFVGATLLFGALTFWLYRSKRKRAELVRTASGLAVRVGGQVLATAPVTLEYGWEKREIRRGVKITTLVLRILKDGQGAVAFTEDWGMIHGEPEGWPARFPPTRATPFHFTVLHGKFVVELARALGEK